MDNFYQIITELWPLNDVQNCILLNIILTNAHILILFLLQNIRWRGILHACSAFIVTEGDSQPLMHTAAGTTSQKPSTLPTELSVYTQSML